jgi:hypothetical protein
VPAAFSQCTWSKDIHEGLGEVDMCRASCPPNWIKLAVRTGRCKGTGGYEAMCCKEHMPWKVPSPLPPKKTAKVLEFEHAVDG